jgi:competence protein ComEC
MKNISNFWKSGPIAKIVTLTLLLALCCGCITTQITPTPISNTAATSTTILSGIGAQTSTSTTVPTSIIELAPTASFTPTIAPSLTATETLSSPLPSENPLRIHFIDVGQGDAILLQTPNGQTMLIDGGDTNTGIVQYLQSVGIQRIDLMIATHPHADHIGGLVQVLQAFPVAKVLTNGQLTTTTVYEHFLDAIASSKAEYAELKRDDLISLDGIDFRALNPANLTNPDLNENSIVLLFTYGKTTFLMMGDSGANTEADLLAANLLSKVNILKVGHHGSSSGSTPAFLAVIKPDVAVYSAGINNSYGRPAPQTIAALKAAGATVYGTNKNGTIIVTANLNGYTISLAKGSATSASTPTGGPTITPTQTVPAAGGLVIVSVTSPVSRGASATLTAKTSPNAICSITVHYKSGPSSAKGLFPKSADAGGMVSWTWTVGAKTTLGTWPIDVTCGGITQSTTFTVK